MPEDTDQLLVARVREGGQEAWEELIARYEGRLLAFVQSRIGNRTTSEDVVQETLLGFLTSLPNYDSDRTRLESFLFSIAAHKLTDVLRRQGRRPTLPLQPPDASGTGLEPMGSARVASSLIRSREGRNAESELLGDVLGELIHEWLEEGQLERLKCLELLLVLGWRNKDVATHMGITEQTVANHKSFVLRKLKTAASESPLGQRAWADFGLEDPDND
ncbi:MAG: sigma-70 family RNA polymerase sigma factor [Planctomycetota bacterium]|nr:sigma-70 family RNA polymerase sigma factor [Planctomycetota bacterium]